MNFRDRLQAVDDHIAIHPIEVLFAAACVLAIGVDIVLVLEGYPSISEWTWAQTANHPAVIGLGMLVAIVVGYFLRASWFAAMVWGVLVGHLLLHW